MMLNASAVIVCALDMACLQPFLENWVAVLSPAELDRARRYRQRQAGVTFIVTRAALRILLSRHLRIEPKDITFGYTDRGKPFIHERTPVNFSVSHSGGMSLIAFTTNAAIGVDIEQIRSDIDLQSISEMMFTAQELTQLASLESPWKQRAFFQGWVRKEAYVKATGAGIGSAMLEYATNLTDPLKGRTVEIPGPDGEPKLWSTHDLCIGINYSAATIYSGSARPTVVRPATVAYLREARIHFS